MLASPLLCFLFLGPTVALSPEEFRRFYQSASHAPLLTLPRPQFSAPGGGYGGLYPHDRTPFNTPRPFYNQGVGGPYPRPHRRPFRPHGAPAASSWHPAASPGHFEGKAVSLVKLRKLYSRLKKGGATTPYPRRHVTIPPDYIRYDYSVPEWAKGPSPPQWNRGPSLTQWDRVSDPSLWDGDPSPALGDNRGPSLSQSNEDPRGDRDPGPPVWSPYRKGRETGAVNELIRYLGPMNRSVIFETRLQAAVGVQSDVDSISGPAGPDTTYGAPSNYLDDGAGYANRSKRYSLYRPPHMGAQPSYLVGRCGAPEGERGWCVTSSRCVMIGGEAKQSTHCSFGVCCTPTTSKCGSTVWTNNTIWSSPSDNSTAPLGDLCSLKVVKISNNICQLRLDLQQFQLKPPNEGSCLEDKLLIDGQNINSIIPQLCGNATGKHLYIDVNNSSVPVELKMVTVGNNFSRKWKIQISQIECDSPHRPPHNCLQYFTQTVGSFDSFNNRATENQYLNNLNYAVCFKKGPGYCSIQYEANSNAEFNFINEEGGVATVTAGNAGVGPIDCPDDYIVIAGNRLCGDRFNDGSLPAMTENAKIKDTTNGPLVVQVKTDGSKVGKGFHLNYQLLPC